MVGFSKTLARYRVSEWHTMYIDYETLKTYVNETKRKREEIMTPGTTSADDQSVYGRDSVDDSQWSRYATAPTLATELEEREKPRGEHDALEQLWEALAMEYEPTLSIKSAIEDGGSGVPNTLREFYAALDVQANKCNAFYEMLVEMQAKALAQALKRINVVDATLHANTPSHTPITSPRESEVEEHSAASETPKQPSLESNKHSGGRHSRAGSLSTPAGTDLHELFARSRNAARSNEEPATSIAYAILNTKSETSAARSRETTVRALLHDIKEIYYSVCMIQNFSTLNAVAIRKITKKMDKESGARMSGIYCTTCDELAFWPDLKESTFQCKTMIKLCEDAFLMCHGLLRRIDEMRSSPGQLTQDDRSMTFRRKERQQRRVLLEKLRDTGKRIKDDGTKVNLERDSKGDPVLFFAGGFFWGIALPALLIPLWYLIVSCGLNSTDERCKRELAAFVTLRGVLLMFGQSLLWGPTVYVWQRIMVHWELIFFRSVGRTGLRAEHAILATVLPWLVFVVVLMTSTVLWSSGQANTTWVKPLTMCLFVVFVTPVPRTWEWADNPRLWFIQPPMKTRRFLFQHFVRIVCSPWTQVVFPDFFIADQITSQSTAIADLMVTFYVAKDTTETRVIAATLPHWWRFVQSLRRARDAVVLKRGGAPRSHLLNAGKYASSIIAVWLRYNAVTRSNYHNSPVWILAYTATAVNIFYALYWDFFMDWTVIEYNPSVKWRFEILPRRTLVKSRTVWAFAVAFNVIARSAGVFAAVPGLPLQHLSTQVLVTGLAGLEVLRRAVWNVFRVENEHSSNCGAFRASGDSQFEALEDPFVHHVDELSKELQYVPSKDARA